MKSSHIAAISMVLAALSGCASTNNVTTESEVLSNPGIKTGVVITRVAKWMQGIDAAPLTLDGQSIGRLSNQPLFVAARPGNHTLQIKGNFLVSREATGLNFAVRPGHVTHVVAEWNAIAGTHMTPIGYGASSIAVPMANQGWALHVAN